MPSRTQKWAGRFQKTYIRGTIDRGQDTTAATVDSHPVIAIEPLSRITQLGRLIKFVLEVLEVNRTHLLADASS